MMFWKAEPDVASYQQIHPRGKENVLCNQLYYAKGPAYKSELRRACHCC